MKIDGVKPVYEVPRQMFLTPSEMQVLLHGLAVTATRNPDVRPDDEDLSSLVWTGEHATSAQRSLATMLAEGQL